MSAVFRFLRRAFGFSDSLPLKTSSQKSIKDLKLLNEGDRVLIDGRKLSPPLQRNAKLNFQHGELDHNAIIGRPISPFYTRTSTTHLCRIEYPTLEQYVSLTPRLVTPVYSSYASTIVSLLDINPEPFQDELASRRPSYPPLEILEAGTGHGSLTLHVARAIAAANPPPLAANLPPVPSIDKKRGETPAKVESQETLNRAWAEWKQTRKAILHTVEKVAANRFHAEKIVRGFHQGLYWPHVDFYVGDVKNWVEQQLKLRRGRSRHPLSTDENEFLDYVLLDMPNVHNQLQHIHPAMRDGAKLIVFAPSVSQIGDCARVIQDSHLPLIMEKVLELGEGVSNGRRWDVRFVKPRKLGNKSKCSTPAPAPVDPEPENELSKTDEEDGRDPANEQETSEAAPVPESEDQSDEPVMICRPLVGERTFGGGFIALFRKTSPESGTLAAEWRQSLAGWSKKRHR
ncbi:uncharacterized protein Z518_09594 [Rhinocladiella mackenziei CBS 650.93]|uniref:tRNA (adenine(58)-N(1))-methyltransferase catalytic subunit TRM61 n=1 Tax=Rhinocladiella mackenziei CBS 650.93 TaxID=1442369 RepID=A0A0D2FIL3_9EURO|nr:uncharacterized protein Z518_09594 [Rhinocladiella mackenziei CBS 650.93]KIX01867.1 hypothetical protein Z518_09594 [Rhinocladiella mackenziei CBS 650.93]